MRDQIFTKEDVVKREKKHWNEIMDMLFDTEKPVLDYLQSHLVTLRKTRLNKLNEDALAERSRRSKNSRGRKPRIDNTSVGSNSPTRLKIGNKNGSLSLAIDNTSKQLVSEPSPTQLKAKATPVVNKLSFNLAE